jgi:hypothetical protein
MAHWARRRVAITRMHETLQPSRIELKFRITEPIAAEIKRYLGATLHKDPHGLSHGPDGYPVCSVYLDSQDASLYGQSIAGERNRFKLRVRVYDADPSSPAFVEIKRRDGQVIKKQRAKVNRDVAAAILGGAPGSLAAARANGSWSPRDWMAMQEFCRLRDGIRAFGTTYVSYLRDAYVSPASLHWRVTFDRGLAATAYRPGETISIPEDCIPARDHDAVILELKFTDRFPRWMHDLVRVFNLNPVSFPKYIHCADAVMRRDKHPSRFATSHAGGRASHAGGKIGDLR